jgi:hypothetical protein
MHDTNRGESDHGDLGESSGPVIVTTREKSALERHTSLYVWRNRRMRTSATRYEQEKIQ